MATPQSIELHFPVIHQYWMDSGLLGFYLLANDAQRYHPEVTLCVDDTGVYLHGTGEDLEKFLSDVYGVLLRDYYNTSTPKQKEENAGFYYDEEKDEFIRFPKVKDYGIAELIFSKAPRPTKESVKYVKDANKQILLPEPYTHLQERFEIFLSENKLKADGARLLINGRNAYQPKVTIAPIPKKPKYVCRLCGSETHAAGEISGTVFPLITSSAGIKSFVSGCENVDYVCWKCDYIAKFVPVVGYYAENDDNTYIFLLNSMSFNKMVESVLSWVSCVNPDTNLFRNYKERLGGYFHHSYEQFFSFLYTVYLQTCTLHVDDEEEGELDSEALYGFYLDKTPLSIYVLHVQKLGQSFVGKLVWNFTESVYLYRLFHSLSESGVKIKEVMQKLVDHDGKTEESKTLVRNKICERVLTKQSIVDLVEQFVFHISRSGMKFIRPIFTFLIAYEKILAGDDTMKQELIDTAVSLGKTLGLTLGQDGKRAKGDLFRLRKARKPSDFLNEVNRIQIKYGVSVTADLYNSGEEFEKNFSEFKQFCMVAALNSFNAKTSDKKIAGESL